LYFWPSDQLVSTGESLFKPSKQKPRTGGLRSLAAGLETAVIAVSYSGGNDVKPDPVPGNVL
jgi:hypothetical protein